MAQHTPSPIPHPPELPKGARITIAYAASYIGCNERTIRRYIARGKLKTIRVGPRLIRIRQTEFARFLKANELT